MQHEYRLQYVDADKGYTDKKYFSEHAVKCGQVIHNRRVDEGELARKVDAVEVVVKTVSTIRAAEEQ